MPKVLFFYLITAAFIGWTLAAPLLAKYNAWLARDRPDWTEEKTQDMAVSFRVMGAIGSLLGILVSILATIAAIRG